MSGGTEAAGRLEEAERLASSGQFDEAALRLESAIEALVHADAPELLARAAWVAALCSIVRGANAEFNEMSQVASEALRLAGGDDASIELESLSRRVAAMAELESADDLDGGIDRILARHVELLRELTTTSDPRRWRVVDAERETWPHLFAAVKALTGAPCQAEQQIARAPRDPVCATLVAVLIGLSDGEIEIDELARLCFVKSQAVEKARAALRKLIAAGIVLESGGRVVLGPLP